MMRYYDYHEVIQHHFLYPITITSYVHPVQLLTTLSFLQPIDPHFNPIDINARVKSIVSLVSEFDILVPQTHSSDSTDDDRSQVLQGINNTSDASSVKSIKFVDESNETDMNENNHQGSPPTNNAEKPLIENKSKEPDEQPSRTNGYVPSDYLPGIHNSGYMDKDCKPSTKPIHIPNVQHQPAGLQASTVQSELLGANDLELRRFGKQISMSSLSSGYVTDLTTPSSEYYKYLTSPDPGASIVTMKTNPAVVSQYPVFDSVQTIDEGLSQEDTNSVVYSIGEGVDSVECEAMGGMTEHKYAESIVAECSLSLNPLHFEPINYDDLVEQTTPSYVNTTPGAELYQTQFDNESY